MHQKVEKESKMDDTDTTTKLYGHGWRYVLDGGEVADIADSRMPLQLRFHSVNNAERAAKIACEMDYHLHDGWERGDKEFDVAVISPDGIVSNFICSHEPVIEHYVTLKA